MSVYQDQGPDKRI